PGQIVVSGEIKAIERAVALAKEKGSPRTVILAVSAPFHCSLMQPAAKRLAEYLAGIPVKSLAYPVITNVEAQPNQEVNRIKELLIRQVTSPVLWEDSVFTMTQMGVNTFIEIGPGRILSGLVKRINKNATILNVEDTASFKKLEKIWKEMN
ncbi:MAG: ACP S-malonyltransferase, partial [Desulfobacterota bacterium]|nr:ACP S-malonyltransferase [Thermodesulfobacteriota bacterium]